MSRQILTNLDFKGVSEIQNSLLQRLPSPPTNPAPVEGRHYYDLTLKKYGYFNGVKWVYDTELKFLNQPYTRWEKTQGGEQNLTILPVTPTVEGLMSAADKVKLNASTAASSASTLVQRDAAGSFGANQITAARVTGLADPTQGTDAASKKYVDAVAQGLAVKQPVRVASVVPITPTGLQTIDGVLLVANDRVLRKNEAVAADNGIWIASATAWTRALDCSVGMAVRSVYVLVSEGVTNRDIAYTCINDAGADIVGTNPLQWEQFSGTGQIDAGAGLTKTNRQLNIGATDASIIVDADSIRARPDNVTLETSATGLQVKAAGIKAAHVHADIVGTGLAGGGGKPVYVIGYTPIPSAQVARFQSFTTTIGGAKEVTIVHAFPTKNYLVQVDDAQGNVIECDIRKMPNAVGLLANGALVQVIVQIVG